jgi:hypothetical protein
MARSKTVKAEKAGDEMIPLSGLAEPMPASVIAWLIDVEERGITLNLKPGDDRIYAVPRADLATDDIAFITAHRADIRRGLAYLDTVA